LLIENLLLVILWPIQETRTVGRQTQTLVSLNFGPANQLVWKCDFEYVLVQTIEKIIEYAL